MGYFEGNFGGETNDKNGAFIKTFLWSSGGIGIALLLLLLVLLCTDDESDCQIPVSSFTLHLQEPLTEYFNETQKNSICVLPDLLDLKLRAVLSSFLLDKAVLLVF